MAFGCFTLRRKVYLGATERLVPFILGRQWLNMAVEATQTTPTSEDPLGLSEANLSRIYTVPNKEVRDLYPRGLPKIFTSLSDTFRETGWILRPQVYGIISRLRQTELPSTQKRFLIHGGDGCGKTLSTGQIVHWCWKARWLVIHVPGVSFWAHSRKDLRSSIHDPNMFDQPAEAASWLGSFKAINARHLKTMRLSEGKVWSKRESSEEGEELMKVIDVGLQKPVLATDIIAVVLEEVIKEHHRRSSMSSENKFQMLLSIDEFNGCYNPCAACISKFESVETRQLNLLKYFRDLVLPDKFPGPVVLALSRRKLFKFFPLTTSPEDLLGKKGMKDTASYEHVEVNELSIEEANRLLNYYKDKRWITREPFERVCQEVWHLSGGNAAEIYKLSQQL